MACNYSSKFLPLVEYNKRMLLPQDPEGFHAFIVNSFNDDPSVIYKALNMPNYVKKTGDSKEAKKINTRQTFIVAETSNVNSAYLGHSDAYSNMIRKFRTKMLEFARIKINFATGDVESVNSNGLLANGVSKLNRDLFEYKLQLVENILTKSSEQNKQLVLHIKEEIGSELSGLNPDINSIEQRLNTLISTVKMLTVIDDSVYDDFVQLTNFDKILKQECPYIEIDERFEQDGLNKYKYVGSKVVHFSGWTSSEFANSMDQASMLVKAVLDYVPEIDANGKPIPNTSIGLSGFYSVMTALRNTILYYPDEKLRSLKKELRKGTECDLAKIIDAYIDYLKAPKSQRGNVSSYYESHRTYLIGKLEGIKRCIFSPKMDKELRDTFNNMFFKNIQMSYVAYGFDEQKNDFAGKDLKGSIINTQLYALSGAIASSVYNLRKDNDRYQTIVGDRVHHGVEPKYKLVKFDSRTGHYRIEYNGRFFEFAKNNKGNYISNTDFELQEFKDIFYDLFNYIIPEDYEIVGRQINTDHKWNVASDFKEVLTLGLRAIHNWGSFEYKDGYPTNITDGNYGVFAKVAKTVSTIYGSDVVNVIKNIDRKKNLPLFGLTSLAHNFHFVMWDHLDNDSSRNIYGESFMMDKYDTNGNLIRASLIREPKVRSELSYNGEIKPSTKLTVSEVFKLSLLHDFYQNLLDGDHIYLQNATFSDKGTHFLINYDLNTPIFGNKTLKELIDEHMGSSNPNSSGLFNLMLQTRRTRINQLIANIIEDYNSVFKSSDGDKKFTSLEEIQTFIEERNLTQASVREAFRGKGVNFYEEIHLSKGKINETILLYRDSFKDEISLAKRLNDARMAFVKDLETNRVFLNSTLNGISKTMSDNYKDWTEKDDTITLYKLDKNGNVVLHPVLEGYFMTNDLLSNEYNEIMIGGVYAHSKSSESGRLVAQIKRSVIYGATMHSFAQGLNNGVADEIKIACMPDVKAIVTNILGTTKDDQDSMDGSGLSTPLQARLESNSLLDARVGYDKKTIGHDIDSEYGRPSLLKWAVYALTNARRRVAARSKISQEVLLKKMYSAGTINLTDVELNQMLSTLGDVYYRDVENTGKYYKIVSFKQDENTWRTAVQEVDVHGNFIGNVIEAPRIVNTQTLWDIDQLFGGAWSMSMVDGKLDYAEANVDALESFVTKHQEAKTAQIGYIVNQSAMKVGVGNLNKMTSWEDDSQLDYITMSTRYIGVQMDAEHELDENEVTEMTQMISAISSHGYTSDIANQVYNDIGNVIVEALAEYDNALAVDNPQEIYKLLGEAFVKSFENNDRDTLGLAQAFVLKASKALKEGDYSFRLPFSAETVNGIFISTISSLLTKKGIRRKYDGFAGVLTPSHNMMQYYRIGDTTMMYEQFTDKVREKGIKPMIDPFTGQIIQSAVERAVNEIWIDGKLNPFIEISSVNDIDFEDTAVIFTLNEDGTINADIEPETFYIQDFGQYDMFKHQDFNGKAIYKFTSRPKNLKGTNTKFKIDGLNYSIYDLDSVRAAYYAEQKINKDYVHAVLLAYGYDPSAYSEKAFQRIIQSNLRDLKKGRSIKGVRWNSETNSYETYQFTATDVHVTSAEIITGRYNAKAFLMDSSDKFSDVIEQKGNFFYKKLRNKYGFDNTEPDWAERVLFSTTGERYLVRTVTAEEKTNLEREGFVKDTSIEQFGNNFYYGEHKIGTFENIGFYKYKDEDGKVWKVILTTPESKNALSKSKFFEMWRDNFTDQDQMAKEQSSFDERIRVRAARMWQAFDKQRYLLGTRIPTQDMQSFMPEEIIGWTDSEVNDLYVPVQMFVTKGNDLDIDKEYELCYGVDNQGLLYVNTKLVNVLDYSYDDLFKLLPPNGIEYKTSKEIDGDTFVITHDDLLGDKIDLINRIIESKTTKVHFEVFDEDAIIFMKHLNIHSTTQLSEEVVDKSIKNQVVSNILKVSTDVENQVVSQISVDTVTKPIKRAAAKSPLALYEKTINSDNPLVMFVMQIQNMVGKEGIGVTAVSLKQFFAKTAFYNEKINEFAENIRRDLFNSQKYVDELIRQVVKWDPMRKKHTVFANLNFLDVIESLSEIIPIQTLTDGRVTPWLAINVDLGNTKFNNLYDLLIWMQNTADENDASLEQSALLSEYTDNAKSLTTSKINASPSFTDIYTYLIQLGNDIESIAKIMGSPAFTYITKLVDGDIFNNKQLSVKNAIKFYLGNYIFEGIDSNSITTILNAVEAKGVTSEDEKYYDVILEICNAIKKTSYGAEAIESAQEYYITSLADNTKTPKPEPLIKQEIDEIIHYFKECKIRDEFIKTNGTADDANIAMILTDVLPGVTEQEILGALCGLNQGLKTKTFDKIKFIQRVENHINNAIKDALKTSFKETSEHAKIRAIVSEILGEDKTFDLFKFASDAEYQNKMISVMSHLKHTDNILEVITGVPHYMQMLHTWAVDEALLRKASVRYNVEKHLMEEVKPQATYSFNESEYTQIKRYVNDMLILNWIFNEDLKLEIPIDQKIYNITGNDDYTLDGVLRLRDVHSLASFKRIVENHIVPRLKETEIGRNNAFLNALTLTSDDTSSGIKSYLKLPVPMMDIEKSVELETAYNSYIRGFDEISTMEICGMKVGDIFYLYNLIVNKDSFGQKSLTRLFENLVNSNKGSFLVNSFNEWISDLDGSGDYSAIKINLIDLMGRISKYATGTSIRQPLNTMYNSDYTFEVPNFAKSWTTLSSEAKPVKTNDSTLKVVSMYDILEKLAPNIANPGLTEESESHFSGLRIITEADWDQENDLMDLDETFKEYLKKQKAFIHNGEIYVNMQTADITDTVHELTHLLLAQMKWSKDVNVRNNYYNLVSQVTEHPNFNDIAKHYPWAHGSDLQEEVLVNLFQMYLQNKVFIGDNILDKFVSSNDFMGTILDAILKNSKDTIYADIPFNMFFEWDDSWQPDNFILKKHQKIMQLKDKLIEEEYLKMICK